MLIPYILFIINITSQYRYLLDHGASVSAVNNDGELAIDISESDEMEELLQKEIDNQVIVLLTGCPTDMNPPPRKKLILVPLIEKH